VERAGRGRGSDEPLRGLTAPGSSKVGTEKAMRARDVSRADAGAGAQPPSSAAGSRPQSDGGAGSSGSSPVDS
jgi:hypothetical protein